MELLTAPMRRQLVRNGRRSAEHAELGEDIPDHVPIVKLFTPDGACTWLLTELDPLDEDLAFGLCDLGFGFPEFGSVRMSELASLRGKLGLPVERDLHFSPDRTIAAYARQARDRGCILA